MQTLYAVILGIVQGLTEFLPVSSSGHLVIFQNALGLREPELLLDISLHVGTLAAVFLVFHREIRDILSALFRLPRLAAEAGGYGSLFAANPEIRLAVLIVAGSVPTGILGVLFHKMAEEVFGTVILVGVTLCITGTFLWLTRYRQGEGRSIDRFGIRDALVIGLAQGIAILPGISRSGATISTALFLGVDRETAGRFSFLLSIPAILGAVVLGLDSSAIKTSLSPGAVALGTLSAAVVGYLSLVFLLKVVKQGRLYRFAPYCWVLGLSALGWRIFF